MSRSGFVGMLLVSGICIFTTALGQKNISRKFTLPANAQYTPGIVLAKVKAGFRDYLLGNPGGRMSHSSIQSIEPLVNPALARKGAAWRGPVARHPVIDISNYVTLRFDPAKGVEEFINETYATGYFEIIEPEYAYRIDFSPNDPRVGGQYYLDKINAFEAWDITQGSEDVTIAIIDSGGQLDHPDLAPNLYVNRNEIAGNGVDDDNDGYIDNVQGWDFIGSDTLNARKPNFTGDNDPSISKGDLISHGTMVAGCASASTNNGVGMAGVGFKTKIMFTKHSGDNQKSTSGAVFLGEKGILYAANQGIQIINCSWGGPSRSQIMQDLITHVTLDLGSLVVAAAGNDGSSAPSYPAAYDYVLSVSATDKDDTFASFSNYGPSVDLAAPGVAITTTIYHSNYMNGLNGTSFSSPITAGAAALVWARNPTFSPLQVSDQLRSTSDYGALINNVNNQNYYYMGRGRLDILKALTEKPSSIKASNLTFRNKNKQPVQPGEVGYLSFDFTNKLNNSSSNLAISIHPKDLNVLAVSKATIRPGVIAAGTGYNNAANPFELKLASNVPPNTILELRIDYSELPSHVDFQFLTITLNPTFIDVDINQIQTSVTNTGRIGYQNTDTSTPGLGFNFNHHGLLFEMGLIMGTSPGSLDNNVRGVNSQYDQDFVAASGITEQIPGQRSSAEVAGSFANNNNPGQQPVVVGYRSMAWKDPPYDKFVILEYTVRNPTSSPMPNFWFGLYADWDISGSNDVANWYADENMGYVYSAQTDPLPYAGIQVLTGLANGYAIDNNQATPGVPFGVYDGFTKSEKFTAISTQRLTAGLPAGGDVSQVVSAGPYDIPAGGEITLAFALQAAANFNDLKISSAYADSVYNFTLKAGKPIADSVVVCYDSPAMLTASGANTLNWYTAFTGGNPVFTGSALALGAMTHDTTFFISNADHSYESVRTYASVVVKANPEIHASGPTTFCEGPSITLSVAGSDSYLWSTGATTQSVIVNETGSYSVTVRSDTLSCQSTSAPLSIVSNPNPIAGFRVDGVREVGKPLQFVDLSSEDVVSWDWTFGDGPTSKEQNPTYAYHEMTDFTVTLVVGNGFGCQDTVSIVLPIVTGLENSDDPVAIYPNPFGHEWIDLIPGANRASVVRVTVFSESGQRVYDEEFQVQAEGKPHQLPLSNLAAGIYTVQLKTADRTVFRKIVKSQ